MKIWITRDSTGSLHAGGLDRLTVWFSKPIYVFEAIKASELDEEIPWGFSGKEGCRTIGWIYDSRARGCSATARFADMFGYGFPEDRDVVKGLPDYVWDKLNEHYGNTEFVHGWYEYEKSHPECNVENFLLEIDLEVIFKK